MLLGSSTGNTVCLFAVLFCLFLGFTFRAFFLALATRIDTLLLIGSTRARDAARVLADLVDTAVDLHTKDLAAALDVPADLGIAEVGTAISQRLIAVPAPAPAPPELNQLPESGEPLPSPGPSSG